MRLVGLDSLVDHYYLIVLLDLCLVFLEKLVYVLAEGKGGLLEILIIVESLKAGVTFLFHYVHLPSKAFN